ncbi:MAG: hypothetical protein Q9191_000285 [Dirinaria sp. TL-2023a]
MGANQSTNGSKQGRAQQKAGAAKICYYELLDIEPQATDEEKAYRKKALELHPDRNFGNVEETTKLFAEVQSAYEVLSDPQERAWYDSHRSSILRGADEDAVEHYEHNVPVTTSEDILRMFSRFNGRKDFTDSANGFFGAARETFDTLAKEETIACEWEGLEPIEYPSFGYSSSQYEEVVRPFYTSWNSFSTKKTFSWKDVYRLQDAPDRRVRRLMEKENKRIRDEGVREFNETVRSLVQFVRKRDPRYVSNTQTEVERQKIIRDAASAQAARSRAANQANAAKDTFLPPWAHSDNPVEEEMSGEDTDEDPEEQFECVVCRKTFKSEKQFETHERSKKHIKAVQQLQKEMRSENRALNLDGQDTRPDLAAKDEIYQSAYEGSEVLYSENQDTRSEPDAQTAADYASSQSDGEISSAAAPEEPLSKKPSSSFSKEITSVPTSDDEYAPRETVEERILSDNFVVDNTRTGVSTTKSTVDDISQQLGTSSISGKPFDAAPRPKAGKAKEKRAKKAAQRSADAAASNFRCAACNAGFPSKTKLFSHIKGSDHAQPVPKAAKGGKGKNR